MDLSRSSVKTIFGLSDQEMTCSQNYTEFEEEVLFTSTSTIFGISDQEHSQFSDVGPDDLSFNSSVAYDTELEKHQKAPKSSTPKKNTKLKSFPLSFSPIDRAPASSNLSKRRLSELRDPIHVLRSECGCEKKCTQSMSISTILECEQKLKHIKESEQKSFILTEIAKHSCLKQSSKHAAPKLKFVLEGKLVCEEAWCLAHNISRWRFKNCKQLYAHGYTVAKHGNVGRRKVSEKTTVALSWMRSLFYAIGDYMPHKTEVHLPRIYTKKMLYQRMIKEIKADERGGSISYEHFTRIWSQHLPEFRITKTNSDFTVCATCTQLDEAYYGARSDEAKKRLMKLKEEHSAQVEKERNAYYDARIKSRRSPQELSCLIIDGMDQSKTDVPHLVIADKDTKPLARLPVHITGVIFHTDEPEGKRPYVYYDIKQFPHDTNLTIHCLVMCLTENKDKLGESLFLQMDNCYRENKNRFLLTFGETLVGLNIFRELLPKNSSSKLKRIVRAASRAIGSYYWLKSVSELYIDMVHPKTECLMTKHILFSRTMYSAVQVLFHFLPVGHTHEDVDQMFSRIAAALRQTNCYTLPDLERCVATAYTPSIAVHAVRNVQDIKIKMGQALSGGMKGQSKPHWFRFSKDAEGKTQMHYKLWVNDPWEPQHLSDGEALHCLKEVPELETVVDWVKPSLEKTDVPRLRKDLPLAYGNRMPPSAREWWTEYIENVSLYENVPSQSEVWKIAGMKTSSTHRPMDPRCCNDIDSIQQRVHFACPPITIAGQGKPNKVIDRVDDLSGLTHGMLVAVHLQDTTSRPYIGRVLERDTDTFTLEWLRGSWHKEWKPWRSGVGRNIKSLTDVLPFDSVLLYGFELSQKGKLNKSTIENLHSLYSELDK